jgi:Rad52/22 family double-strand break repair protein
MVVSNTRGAAVSEAPNIYDSGMLEPDAGKKVGPALIDERGMPTREGWRKIAEYFAKPFEHKTYRTPKGQSFDYITARQLGDRLDAVVGVGNWQTCFKVIDAEEHVVECTLTLFDNVSKADVGYPNSPGRDFETEPFKAAYSDAFKRAGVQFGIGRYLYGD